MIYKKKVLWLMAIAIIMVIVSVACSGNPTNAGDYIVAKQAEQSPKPEMKLTVDTNQGLIQFKDLSFKSGAYYINGNYTRKIYYYADVKVDENSKPYISAITKSEDGEIIEEEGKFYETSTNESGEFYNLEGVRYQSGNKLTAEATFNESGYLVIRFSNYSLDITYSLIEETIQGGSHSRTELVGTWKVDTRDEIIINIDSDGNFSFDCGGQDKYSFRGNHYKYTGKLAETFEYPYTIELTFAVSSHSCNPTYNNDNEYDDWIKALEPKSKTGKFTFHDASTLTASLYLVECTIYNAIWGSLYTFDDNTAKDEFWTLNYKSFRKQ